MRNRSKIIKLVVFVVLLVALSKTALEWYASDYYLAKTYEVQTEKMEETEDYIVYGDTKSSVGFIFYPGAKVDEAAYAPILDALAEDGMCCVVVKMPYHMAIFDTNAATDVGETFSDVKQWYIGGHSMGGAMAAGYATRHEAELEGLILLAAYPTKEIEELPVLSVYGSEDEVLNLDEYEDSITYAENLTERIIEGGNHAGFGNYGEQKGDGTAEIMREEQWQETVDYILNFIKDSSDDTE